MYTLTVKCETAGHTHLPGPQEKSVAINLCHGKVIVPRIGRYTVEAPTRFAGQEERAIGTR